MSKESYTGDGKRTSQLHLHIVGALARRNHKGKNLVGKVLGKARFFKKLRDTYQKDIQGEDATLSVTTGELAARLADLKQALEQEVRGGDSFVQLITPQEII
jgi:hypothetical protein